MNPARTIYDAIQRGEPINWPAEDVWQKFKDWRAQVYLVEDLVAAGKYAMAREILCAMTDTCYDSAPKAIIIVNAYERMGDYTQAIAVLGTYMALGASHEYSYRRLARLLLKRGGDQSAMAALEKGWKLKKRELRKSEWQTAKAQYFASAEKTKASRDGVGRTDH